MGANLLRTADRQAVPWKNGGGVTQDVAIHPPNAGMSDFAWRVSIATVARNGPFSHFADIDRTLTILDGGGIRLTFGLSMVDLTSASLPFSFAGDVACEGELLDGPIHDLNVMTRRGRFSHQVLPLRLPIGRHGLRSDGTSLLLWRDGKASLESHGESVIPEKWDALLCDGAVTLNAESPSEALLVSFFPVPPA